MSRDEMDRRILITGANGFIGNAGYRFFRSRGFTVRSHARSKGFDLSGDLESESAAEQALQGVDCLLHTAGMAHAKGPGLTDLHRINVEWPARLASICRRRAIRFVHLSSSKVYGETGHFGEDSVLLPGDAYAKAKADSEKAVLDACPDALVLRIPPVYGPGSKGSFRTLVRAVQNGWPLPFGRVRAKRSYLFVDTLHAAAEFLLSTKKTGIWNVSDDHDIALADLINAIGEACGRHARLVSLPEGMLRAALALRPGLYAKIAGEFTLDVSRLREAGVPRPREFMAGLRAASSDGKIL